VSAVTETLRLSAIGGTHQCAQFRIEGLADPPNALGVSRWRRFH
jgi:hypothetical protein